jgi:hypothetical protein
VLSLSLLSNCLLVPAVREASRHILQQQPQTLDSLATLLQQGNLRTCSSSEARVAGLLAVEKVLGLISNLSLQPSVRQQLAQHQQLLQQLLTAAGLRGDSSTAQQQGAVSAVKEAALGCLCNLSLEQQAQQRLTGGQIPAVLLAMTTAAAGSCSKGCSAKVVESPAAAAAGPRLPPRKQQQQQQQSPAVDAADSRSQQDQLLTAQRAAVLLSRAAKQTEGLQQLQQLRALPKLLEAIAAVAATQQQQGVSKKQQKEQQQASQGSAALLSGWFDAAWRTVALLTAQPGACSSSSCSAEDATTAISACLAVLQAPGAGSAAAAMQQQSGHKMCNQSTSTTSSSSNSNHPSSASSSQVSAAVQGSTSSTSSSSSADGHAVPDTSQPGPVQCSAAVQGNAALVLGHFAAKSCWHSKLQKADAVRVLVAVAHAHGCGSAVARNGAIALARMARDGGMMERLRELHGVEIIYQYVRP